MRTIRCLALLTLSLGLAGTAGCQKTIHEVRAPEAAWRQHIRAAVDNVGATGRDTPRPVLMAASTARAGQHAGLSRPNDGF